MKLSEIADRLNAHLKRFEADPAINKPFDCDRLDLRPYYQSGASSGGGWVHISYISYQGHRSLRRADAEQYLTWLDAGHVGRHTDALREGT